MTARATEGDTPAINPLSGVLLLQTQSYVFQQLLDQLRMIINY